MTTDKQSELDAAGATFQSRVQPWLMACFGELIAGDRKERNHRFLEEALELVQSCGCDQSEAHQLVDYVYGRDVGEPAQEVGGVMVTLAALCLANGIDMDASAETELTRIWTKVEKIRAKQAAKPKHSPLPMHVPEAIATINELRAEVERLTAELEKTTKPHFWWDVDDSENGCDDITSILYNYEIGEVVEVSCARNLPNQWAVGYVTESGGLRGKTFATEDEAAEFAAARAALSGAA